MNIVDKILENQQKATSVLKFEIEPAGYGATLSRLMVGLNMAIINNAVMDFVIRNNYKVEELFDLSHLRNNNKKNRVLNWNFFRDTWDHPSRNATIYPDCPIQSMDRHDYATNIAQVILGKPTVPLKAHIADQKAYLKWDSYDVHIGVHVRRGDKTMEHPHVPVSVYLKFLNEELKRYEGKRVGVYLTSDDPNVKNEFLAGADILWDDREKRYNNSNVEMVGNNYQLGLQESITAARIICMLGNCDAVIGLESTQFTWLGGLLMLFKNGFDKERHIMINPRTFERGHWGAMYTKPSQ
jgi:hypothetical protein